jgi:hypothetical protein
MFVVLFVRFFPFLVPYVLLVSSLKMQSKAKELHAHEDVLILKITHFSILAI